MKKSLHSTDSQTLKSIRGHGEVWELTSNHFKDVGGGILVHLH